MQMYSYGLLNKSCMLDHLLKTCQLFPKEVDDHCAENKAGKHSE